MLKNKLSSHSRYCIDSTPEYGIKVHPSFSAVAKESSENHGRGIFLDRGLLFTPH